MKTITLQEACNLIQDSAAIIIDGIVTYASLEDLSGDPENEWMHIGWTDDRGHDYGVKFIEEDQEILFDGTTIYIKDHEDDEQKITLLVPMKG